MKFHFINLLFCLMLPLAKAEPIMKVGTDNSAISAQDLKNTPVEIYRYSPSWDVSVETRDGIFGRAGLTDDLTQSNFDQLGRDELFQSLRFQELAQTSKKYPSLSAGKLKAAKKIIMKDKNL